MSKTAIITGASRGIGAATALSLAKDGYNLFLCGNRSATKLHTLSSQCRSAGVQCVTYAGDLSNPEEARQIIKQALSVYDHIDVLINNAGISYVGLMQSLPSEDWNRILAVNLSAAFYLCQSLVPHMVQQQHGQIINVSSIWGVHGASCEVAYSATKGGLNTLTKALAKELAPSGISVNAIACGMIDTQMNACFSEEEVAEICEEIPCGRMASPSEVGDFITLLLKASPYMTGQIIGFDGGWGV
ncbi:MAG: elongation factor P 5-aminopentanone reductase [Eubacterium sp.]